MTESVEQMLWEERERTVVRVWHRSVKNFNNLRSPEVGARLSSEMIVQVWDRQRSLAKRSAGV